MTTPQNLKPYTPVSCDMTDELEALSVKNTVINFRIRNEEGGEALARTGKIQDIFARDHADFLKLEDGSEYRLDTIVEFKAAS